MGYSWQEKKSAFRIMVWMLERCAKLIGRAPHPAELHWTNMLYNLSHLIHCYAEIEMSGTPFYFDSLRLSYSNVTTLMERIQNKDCYRLCRIETEQPVVLDIGAHIGVFCRYALLQKPEGRVYAVEPDSDNFRVLCMNLKPFRNAVCFQKGVLDRKESLELYTSRRLDWRSTLMVKDEFARRNEFEPGEYVTRYRVEVTDLDSFVAEQKLNRVDLLKITVPGEIEPAILLGALEMINAYRPQISLYAYAENSSELDRFFKRVGGYREILSGDSGSKNIRVFSPT